jgi:hypothetical protein
VERQKLDPGIPAHFLRTSIGPGGTVEKPCHNREAFRGEIMLDAA